MENVGERYVAEIDAEGRHLRLFSELTMTGTIALVYNMKSKQAIIQKSVNDLREGQEKCEECATGLLSKPPKIVWTHQP
jgi:hypothetical protein